MKNKILFLLSIVCLSTQLTAQPKIDKSVSIESKITGGGGYSKVLQLNNGNTFFFHEEKKEVVLSIFDSHHKLIRTTTPDGEYWHHKGMKHVNISGVYEINKEAVIFYERSDRRKQTLFRMRLNGATGAVISDESLASIVKPIVYMSTMEFGNLFVEKDPESDAYAVVVNNLVVKNPDERVQVMHFDGNHKMLSTAFYKTAGENRRKISYCGAAVDGIKSVFLTVYCHQGEKDEEAHLFVGKLENGHTNFIIKPLDFTSDFKQTNGVMTINHRNNTLLLLVNALTHRQVFGSKSFYSSTLIFLDPETLSVKGAKPLNNAKVDAFGQSELKKDTHFGGMPMELVVNKDNSIVITQEELTQEVFTTGKSVHYSTTLGNAGIAVLDENAEEKEGYEIAKKQIIQALLLDQFYVSDRRKGIFVNNRFRRNDVEYRSYLYARTGSKNFVIINDNVKNFEKEDNEKKKAANAGFAAILYTLENNKAQKTYLFGEPEGKYNTSSCFLQAADYKASTNVLATVLMERSARHDYEAKIVWVDFN